SASEETRKALLRDCSVSFDAMLEERTAMKGRKKGVGALVLGGGKQEKEELDQKVEVVTQPDSLINFRQLRENRMA